MLFHRLMSDLSIKQRLTPLLGLYFLIKKRFKRSLFACAALILITEPPDALGTNISNLALCVSESRRKKKLSIMLSCGLSD